MPWFLVALAFYVAIAWLLIVISMVPNAVRAARVDVQHAQSTSTALERTVALQGDWLAHGTPTPRPVCSPVYYPYYCRP